MIFAEYRFAIKPWLNILPTKTFARRQIHPKLKLNHSPVLKWQDHYKYLKI